MCGYCGAGGELCKYEMANMSSSYVNTQSDGMESKYSSSVPKTYE